MEAVPEEEFHIREYSMPNRDQLGYHPVIWMEALFKRITESEAGRGGVEAICQFADQVDFIPEIVPLIAVMKSGTIFYETAFAKCGKDLLKRPVTIRENEAADFLATLHFEAQTKWNID